MKSTYDFTDRVAFHPGGASGMWLATVRAARHGIGSRWWTGAGMACDVSRVGRNCSRSERHSGCRFASD